MTLQNNYTLIMNDHDIDKIIEKDRKRIQLSLTKHKSKKVSQLVEIIAPIIYRNGVNNGNIYADWLAEELIKTGKIKLINGND